MTVLMRDNVAITMRSIKNNMTDYTLLEEKIGHTFSYKHLLEIALSHRSVGSQNNERMEFLGDAVLGHVIAHELFARYPDAQEGDLSRMRSALVNREMLAIEAIIGAMYIDANFEVARQCILLWFENKFSELVINIPIKDPKSTLQEWLQARHLPLPQYAANATGEAHAQTFHVICRVQGLDMETKGVSSSRRKAEQLAAQQFLDKINE